MTALPEGVLGVLVLPGIGEVIAYRSERDAAVVVEIDTPEATVADGTCDEQGVPQMRVYVNDDAVWEHPAVGSPS